MRPGVEEALDILTAGSDYIALRRALFATVASRYLSPNVMDAELATNVQQVRPPLEVLLTRLPTRTLSSVAFISKGRTGIKDAQPGPFPLVVTAEERGRSDHFDFEGPAVMIPMVSSTGHGDASLKRVHFQDGQYAVGSILAVVQPKDPEQLSARYLHTYLSGFKDELLVSRMVGTANVSLTVAKIGEVPVPLLPSEAQRKVDELMALCDRLEARQQDAEAAHAQLVQVLLESLTQARDADDFRASWRRLAGQFQCVFTTEASVEALKHVVLELAADGKLVAQDPADRSALDYLAEHGIAGKAHSRRNWASVELVALGIVLGGATPSKANAEFWQGSIPWVSPKDMKRPVINDAEDHISHAALDASPMKLVPAGSILMVVRGMILAHSFPVAMTTAPVTINQDMKALVPPPGIARYLLLALQALKPTMVAMVDRSSHGTCKLVSEKLWAVEIGIPPMEEQRRIVAKVDELHALCDRLKAGIATVRAKHAQLAEVLVAQAVTA